MRIISGKYRGRIIIPPKNFSARPTTDFAKESLFNIINNEYNIEEIISLDLFSGTGSISFELASRGCQNITAVEISYKYAAFIRKNAENMGMKIKVVNHDFFKFVKFNTIKYDLIFADPPYDLENLHEIPSLIFDNELLNSNGTLILEHPEKYNFSDYQHFEKLKTYGKVNFSFFYFK